MKKIVRNNLWMIIIAWCLYLNGNSVLGLITGALATIYLAYNTHNRNAWRMTSITIITFVLCVILAKATIIELFKYFTFFTVIISLNVSFINERLYKERIATIYPIFLVCFITLIIFCIIASILPNEYVLGGQKTNIFALIIIIFMPYTSLMIISLMEKEYNRKKVLDKIRYKYTKRMHL